MNLETITQPDAAVTVPVPAWAVLVALGLLTLTGVADRFLPSAAPNAAVAAPAVTALYPARI